MSRMAPRVLRFGPDLAGAGARVIDADPSRTLLDVLRSELGVRSAARGCQDGSCGSCRVLLDGALVPSCQLAWGDVKDGAFVETYGRRSPPIRPRAGPWTHSQKERPTRCRMCVGALGVTAVAIARSLAPESPEGAKDDAIEGALRTATCMCTGRGSWRRALSK